MRGDHIRLPLLGSRDYVHGTSIFAALVDWLGAEFPVDLRFQSPIRGMVKFGPVWDGDKPNAIATFRSGGSIETLGLYDAGDSAGLERRPWDEDAIAIKCKIADAVISSDHCSDASLIQRVVVMNKSLMSGAFPQRGKWLFARLDVASWNEKAQRVALVHEGGLGSKLTKSRIDLDGNSIGHIYFSLAQH